MSRASSTTPLLTHSSVSGPLDPPLITKTLPAFWRTEILAKNGDRPALISCQEKPRTHGGPISRNLTFGDGRDRPYLAWDYEEFGRHVDALARGLLGMGVEKGDRVGVIMGNTRCVVLICVCNVDEPYSDPYVPC